MMFRRAALALALGLVALTATRAQEIRPETLSGSSPETRRSALPWLSLESLAATRNRPIFAQDRRPLPPPAPPAPPQIAQIKQPSAPPRLVPTLRGIIVQPTATFVLLQDQATSDSVVVRSGENFGPWQVTVQSDHSVQLVSGSEKISLDLFDD